MKRGGRLAAPGCIARIACTQGVVGVPVLDWS
jgi:hypothetical protein